MSVEGINYDNILIRGLSRIGDVILLSIMWTVFSIPLVTIGASTTALLYACMRGITNGEGYMHKLFIKSFKDNFKQSTIAWLILAVVGFVLSFDVYFWITSWLDQRISLVKVIIVISIILLCLYLLILLYTFPLIAKFKNSIFMTFKNSLLLSIRNFPWTILMLIIHCAVGFFLYISPNLLILMAAFGVGTLGFVFAFIYLRCFNPFISTSTIDNVATKTVSTDIISKSATITSDSTNITLDSNSITTDNIDS